MKMTTCGKCEGKGVIFADRHVSGAQLMQSWSSANHTARARSRGQDARHMSRL